MKKLMSIVLTLALVLGMSTVAFATFDNSYTIAVSNADGVQGGTLTVTIEDGDDSGGMLAISGSGSTFTIEGPDTNFTNRFSTTPVSVTETAGKVVIVLNILGTAPTNTYAAQFGLKDGTETLTINLTGDITAATGTLNGETVTAGNASNETVAAGTIGKTITNIPVSGWGTAVTSVDITSLLTSANVGRITITKAELNSSGNLDIMFDVSGTASAGNTTSTFRFDDTLGGTLVLTLRTNITAAAGSTIPSGAKIVGISANIASMIDLPTGIDYSELRADQEIDIELTAAMFKWDYSSGGTNFTGVEGATTTWGNARVSESQLSRGNITVRTSNSKGSNAIDSIKLDGGSNAVIRISLVEWFVSTSDQDIDVTIYLAYKNSRDNNSRIDFTGTISNPEEEVYGDDDYASGEDGAVIKAEEYARNVEVYGGNGVYAIKNLFKGQKYYFVATQEVDNTDSAVMNQYPTISTVIRIRQVNMSGSGNFIELRDLGDTYYVYNADGTYIGTSGEALPFSTKYYLSTERINMGNVDNSSSTDPSESSDPTGDGGAGGDNSTGNPGTGVNGFVNIAIVTGLIALVTAGAVSMKKK